MDSKINIAGITSDSIVDGPGIRCTVFCQGCAHHCPECHNPETHAFGTGIDMTPAEIAAQAAANPLCHGVTFSGGDPLYQPEGFTELARILKSQGYETACYTGFTWEELITEGTPAQKELLSTIDILIDGRYESSLRSLECRFRGSTNQRIIDVPASLASIEANQPSPVLCRQKRWTGDNEY